MSSKAVFSWSRGTNGPSVGFEIEYQIENHEELVINTPTYLGYQLGSLRFEDHGLSIYRSTSATKKNWRWINIDLFKNGLSFAFCSVVNCPFSAY